MKLIAGKPLTIDHKNHAVKRPLPKGLVYLLRMKPIAYR